MKQPGVDPDHERCPGDQPGHRIERPALGDARIAERCRNSRAAIPLDARPPRQQELDAAAGQHPAGLDPRLLRPFLGVSRSSMQQDAVRRGRRTGQTGTVETEIEDAVGRMTQGKRRQQPISRDCVQAVIDPVPHIVESGCWRLADALRIVAVTAAPRELRHHRGAHQSLGVDDLVEGLRAQRHHEVLQLTPCGGPVQPPAPSPRIHRNDHVDGGMKPHQRRERFLDRPGDARVGAIPPHLGHRRHVMYDVAERGSLDEQNIEHDRRPPLGSCRPCTALRPVTRAVSHQMETEIAPAFLHCRILGRKTAFHPVSQGWAFLKMLYAQADAVANGIFIAA